MQTLISEERAAFMEAASGFLGQTERLEFYREQAAAAPGAQTGRQGVRQPEAAIGTRAERLYGLLCQLKLRHPEIHGFRFRGHLFLLRQDAGRVVGMNVWEEAKVEDVEG